jgi:predicted small secreted protein
MKKLIPLLALTAAILTACPTPQPAPAGTSVPTTGGTVSSGDTQASLVAPSANTGTFVSVIPSSDQGQIPTGLTFARAYHFQVTAGSLPSATISINTGVEVVKPVKGNPVPRLYRRDGTFWRYVDGQSTTNGKLSATVQTFGVYGILNGVAAIKLVVTPNPVNLTVGQTQQMTAAVRDSLDQPLPSVDSQEVTWILESALALAMKPQVLEVVGVNTISATGLFTANAVATDKIIATTNQNVEVRVPVTVTKGVILK